MVDDPPSDAPLSIMLIERDEPHFSDWINSGSAVVGIGNLHIGRYRETEKVVAKRCCLKLEKYK